MLCRILVIGLLLSQSAGCISPLYTQFPQPFPRDLRAEGQSYRFHDPFPSADMGPDTASRPPGYSQPRTQERTAAENRLLRGYNLQMAPTGPLPPRTSWDYPDAVQTH